MDPDTRLRAIFPGGKSVIAEAPFTSWNYSSGRSVDHSRLPRPEMWDVYGIVEPTVEPLQEGQIATGWREDVIGEPGKGATIELVATGTRSAPPAEITARQLLQALVDGRHVTIADVPAFLKEASGL